MIESIQEFVDKQLVANDLSREDLWWGVLFFALLFAFAHLLTMLVTRWGDHKATTKSLVFSLLAHVVLGMSLILMKPPTVTIAMPTEDEKPLQIKNIFVEGEEQQENKHSGNTPLWERPPEQVDEQLTRLERTPLELQPLQSPKREEQELTRPDMTLPDLNNLPKQPTVVPQAEVATKAGPHQEAVTPLKIEAPTAESKPEVEIPSLTNVRSKQVREGDLTAEVKRTSTARGAIDRVDPKFDPKRLLASINAPKDARSAMKRSSKNDNVMRRTGPAPSTILSESTGTTASNTQKSSSGSSPVRPRFSRSRTRTPRSTATGSLERFRPERLPSSPTPRPSRVMASRSGLPQISPRSGLQPNVSRPNFDAVRSMKNAVVPSTYQLRKREHRKEAARKYGGTDASERAVEMSLRWLAAQQTKEGYWDADAYGSGQVKVDEEGVDRKNAGIKADTGLTALTVLCFLGAGYTHEEGIYSENIERALKWLMKQQQKDGYLGGDATRYAKMYCHGMTTYALAEAYGLQSDPTLDIGLRKSLEQGVNYIVEQQNSKDGGWRYVKGQRGDMSMFGWQLMALKSAEIAGVPVPRKTKVMMVRFLKERSLGKAKGLASYRAELPVSASMTAEALFCKQMLGIKRENESSKEAVDYIMKRMPNRREYNLYYWYYGTLAMYQYGGDSWRQWNETVRDRLVEDQTTEGKQKGSWAPVGIWGPYGGRLYSTALSTLCLEVYYRFLPLYQMGGQYDDE